MTTEIGCLECSATMEVSVGPHRYISGLDVVLQNIEVRRCPECGEEEVVIPKIEELHGVIAKSISKRPGQLQPREIRFLRTFLGYSSVDFSRLLGVTPETVSRWEKLRNPQKMARTSERLLRMLAHYGEPSRPYDFEQILLSDTAPSSPWAFRFTQTGGEWALNEPH